MFQEIKKEIRFALYAIGTNIKNSAELRGSFIANIVGMTINNGAFVVIWVFFVKSVGVINGWTATDIVGLMGFSSLAYGFVCSVFGGIRQMPDYVSGGGFDRFLLSPKNLFMRVATSSFQVSALGDILFGVVCLAIYGVLTSASEAQIFLIFPLTFMATIAFLAATLSANSASFLFVDAHSVSHGLFELFITPAIFHGGAFQGATRFFFTFIIPSLSVAALPVEIVRDLSPGKLLLVTLVAVGWFFLSLKFFYAGVRRYESTNFMTFGN